MDGQISELSVNYHDALLSGLLDPPLSSFISRHLSMKRHPALFLSDRDWSDKTTREREFFFLIWKYARVKRDGLVPRLVKLLAAKHSTPDLPSVSGRVSFGLHLPSPMSKRRVLAPPCPSAIAVDARRRAEKRRGRDPFGISDPLSLCRNAYSGLSAARCRFSHNTSVFRCRFFPFISARYSPPRRRDRFVFPPLFFQKNIDAC